MTVPAEGSTTPPGRRVPQWTLGERMAKARTDAGFSQADMAFLFGKDDKTISSWETGARRPRDLLDTIRDWATITDVSETWLLTGDDRTLTKYDSFVTLVPDPPYLQLPLPGVDTSNKPPLKAVG